VGGVQFENLPAFSIFLNSKSAFLYMKYSKRFNDAACIAIPAVDSRVIAGLVYGMSSAILHG
jgi:hypothetical protein